MDIIRKIGTAGMAALAIGGLAATTAASAASASTTAPTAAAKHLPVLYGAMGPRWHNNGARPSYIAMGARWTVQRMSWFRWNGSSAYGSGKEVAADFQRAYRWWLRITLTDVKRHDGHLYYSKMKMVGNDPFGSNVQHLVMRGGFWIQR